MSNTAVPPLVGTADVPRAAQEHAAQPLERPRRGGERNEVRGDGKAQPVTSNGHAGPGGEKGGRLNVVA